MGRGKGAESGRVSMVILRDSVQFMPARGSDTQLLIALYCYCTAIVLLLYCSVGATSFTHFFHTLDALISIHRSAFIDQHSSISIHRDTDATSHAALKQHCKQHCKDAQGHAQGHLNDLASE